MDTTATTQTYTPYGVAKLLNDTFTANGIDRTVPPQMIYNYTKNGMINGTKYPKTAGVTFDEDTVKAWIIKYIEKNYKVTVSFETDTTEEDNVECDGQEELFQV